MKIFLYYIFPPKLKLVVGSLNLTTNQVPIIPHVLSNQFAVCNLHYTGCSVEVCPEGGSVVYTVKSCHQTSINSLLWSTCLL